MFFRGLKIVTTVIYTLWCKMELESHYSTSDLIHTSSQWRGKYLDLIYGYSFHYKTQFLRKFKVLQYYSARKIIFGAVKKQLEERHNPAKCLEWIYF